MKITEAYSKDTSDITNVESAKYIGDFAIRIKFNDNTETMVDFKPFLLKAHH